MNANHLWNRAKEVQIQTSAEITGNFSIGFDSKIPEEIKDQLMNFVYWVEDNFHLPVTLWVDFKYQHYLLDSRKKRVGYNFYWVDFSDYPVFENPDDIPVIELAVRLEHHTIDEILQCFTEAISRYFAWLTNTATSFNKEETQAVLAAYKKHLAK